MIKVKVPRKRNWLYYKEDKEYTSVTKILKILDKPALFYWAVQQASRIALKDPSLNEKEIHAKVTEISRLAANRGRNVHSVVESFVTSGSSVTDKLEFAIDEEHRGFIRAFIDWWDLHKPEITSSEVEVYSEKYGYAGRYDMTCRINGVHGLVDIKTGKAIYKEVELQNVAYKQAIHESGIAELDKTWVLLLRSDGTFAFEPTDAKFEVFLAAKRLFEWNKGKE